MKIERYALLGTPIGKTSFYGVTLPKDYEETQCRVIYSSTSKDDVERWASEKKVDGLIVEVLSRSETELVKYHKIVPQYVDPAPAPVNTGVYR